MKNDTTVSVIQIECRVIEEVADCGNTDTDAIWDTLYMQLEKLEGQIYQYKWGKWLWQEGWRCHKGSDASQNTIIY